jgi:hypothetical protein
MKISCKADIDKIVDYVRGSVVLHNYLCTDGTNDGEWMDLSEVQLEDDLEPEPSRPSNQADYGRRDELYYYLSELDDTVIN